MHVTHSCAKRLSTLGTRPFTSLTRPESWTSSPDASVAMRPGRVESTFLTRLTEFWECQSVSATFICGILELTAMTPSSSRATAVAFTELPSDAPPKTWSPRRAFSIAFTTSPTSDSTPPKTPLFFPTVFPVEKRRDR